MVRKYIETKQWHFIHLTQSPKNQAQLPYELFRSFKRALRRCQ